jgi:hypothetical protein
MVQEKMPCYLLTFVLLLFTVTMLAVQPYSVTSRWHAYDKPARLFLRAAARGDSLTLVRRTTSSTTAQWALTAARAQPDSFLVWAGEARAWAGTLRGDTAEVFLSAESSQCNLVLRFVGVGSEARVDQASSECLGAR